MNFIKRLFQHPEEENFLPLSETDLIIAPDTELEDHLIKPKIVNIDEHWNEWCIW